MNQGPPNLQSFGLETIVRLWEKNVDIHIAQEHLKHQRITHFVPVQLAIGAAVGFLTAKWLNSPVGLAGLPWLAGSWVLQAFALYQANSVRLMDRRAADYIRLAKEQNRDLERILREAIVDSGLPRRTANSVSTYTRQHNRFGLGRGRNRAGFVSGSVHKSEQALISAAMVIWASSLAAHSVGFGWMLTSKPAEASAARAAALGARPARKQPATGQRVLSSEETLADGQNGAVTVTPGNQSHQAR